jgi:hypothetical protein
MAKKKANKKKSKNNNNASASASADAVVVSGGLMVDPARIRFQHARIRPYFSGCGRSLVETLDEIRHGKLSPSELPPIQVLVGPPNDNDDDEGGPWYFSLNNRRLWVLKRCREEGLLVPHNNQIFVRVRKPKSQQEAARYSLEHCALEAKIMPEKPKGPKPEQEPKQPREEKSTSTPRSDNLIMTKLEDLKVTGEKYIAKKEQKETIDEDSDSDSSSEEQPSGPPSKSQNNRFSLATEEDESSDDGSESDDEPSGPTNRFSALY